MDGGQRVVVGVTGSVGNLEALRCAAEEARRRAATLLAVHAWAPPGGEMAERRCSVPELRQVWRDAAWRRLWDAFDAALGGLPPDLRVEPTVLRGDPGRALVRVASQQDDLLVVGAGRRGILWRLLRRRVCRYCVAHAVCPVLVVPPSELAQEMEHPLHAWMVRHRSLVPGKDELSGHRG
ncbi:MAG TPA: universal stress protein [Streptosporangiaceae bacterium]|nr:universal stress protein [Streptosporangiaceae bacterium]